MFRLIALACLLAYAAADCKRDDSFKASLCGSGAVLKVDPASIKVSPYPPSITSVLDLSFNYTNPGQAYDRFDLHITSVSYWGSVLGGACEFHKIPFVSPTIKCEDLGTDICPTKTGANSKNSKIDLSNNVIAKILSLFGGDTYYEFSLEFKTGDTLLACVTIDCYLKK